MEEGDLNPSEPTVPQEHQVIYMSDGTYYTTADGSQETMVTYMYGDDQTGEAQYMMIQGDGEGDLQGGGEPYVVTSADGVQYVLVSSDMAGADQQQYVLDQSSIDGQMTIMPGVLGDHLVSGEGLQGAIQVTDMTPSVPGVVDFLNNIEPVTADPNQPIAQALSAAETELISVLGTGTVEGQPEATPFSEAIAQPEAASIGEGEGIAQASILEVKASTDLTGETTTASGSQTTSIVTSVVSETTNATEAIAVAPAPAVATPAPAATKPIASVHVSSQIVSPMAISSVVVPSVGISSGDGDKLKKTTESLAKSIRVTSVPLPSSSDPSKDPKPIITVKPSAVKTLDGDRIKIETIGGLQKVFILPVSSPEKTTTTKTTTSTMPVRLISQEQISSVPIQTITLPLTTTAMAATSLKQHRPVLMHTKASPANIMTPNIIKRPVGRPPLKDKAKMQQQQLQQQQQQRGAPVKIRPSSSQVIVIPIQIAKDSTASTQLNGANTKVTPSGAGMTKYKTITPAVKSQKDLVGKIKATPKETKNQGDKSEDEGTSSGRRSKRGNMSMKLAEWGLLPTGNRSASSSDDELDEELDFDDEEDERNDLDDDIESDGSISLGIYTKSAQKGARKLAALEEKRLVTPVSTKVPVGKAPVRVIPSGSAVKKTPGSLQAPKEMQNKSLMCKPIMMTKATSCNPIRMTKVTQTEEDEGDVTKVLIPVPVPLFVPAPVATFSKPAPVPIPLPVPVPIPAFMPFTKSNIAKIIQNLKEVRETLPVEPCEADVLKVADVVAEGSQETNPEDNNGEVVVKQEPVVKVESVATECPQVPLDVAELAMQIASQIPEDSGEMAESNIADMDSTLIVASGEQGSGITIKTESASKRVAYGSNADEPASKKTRVDSDSGAKATAALRQVPINDLQMKLKYSYGISAWQQWVGQKNTELQEAGGSDKRVRLFKTEILQCNSEELNFYLSLFIKEVRKPTGEEYAPDSVYYLCLGIQHYLYENGRIDSLFTDDCYRKFADSLNELLTGFEIRLSAHGQIICRITEEHLWESRQLGAHSPYNLLNTLVYFNTKHFMLNTVESHKGLSFSNIMKQWKKNAPSTDGRPARTVFLRYNAAGSVVTPVSGGDINQRRKSADMPYEQLENPENPMRCPVKLYEFYLSKCPESIKHRNDLFYLLPEPSCVPDSPVWYSTVALSPDALSKMLNRMRIVREIQETQINQLPSCYT